MLQVSLNFESSWGNERGLLSRSAAVFVDQYF